MNTATLNTQVQVKALQRQQLDTTQQRVAARQSLAQIALNLASVQTATRSKLADLKQTLAQNAAQASWILRAPRAGLISSLLIHAGQTAVAGQPLLALLPQGSKLEAQLLVPSHAVGFIRRGEQVVLRYQAYPYQKFGQHYGTVAEVSRSALSPREAQSLLGRPVSQPLYRVIVHLDRQHLEAYGRPARLMPGMVLSADILLDRRRLLEWVIEPMVGFGRRLLNSPSSAHSEGPT